MDSLSIVVGTPLADQSEKGVIRLLTPKGDLVSVIESLVVSVSPLKMAEGMQRYVVAKSADAKVKHSRKSHAGISFAEDEIEKWDDDGGPVGKS